MSSLPLDLLRLRPFRLTCLCVLICCVIVASSVQAAGGPRVQPGNADNPGAGRPRITAEATSGIVQAPRRGLPRQFIPTPLRAPSGPRRGTAHRTKPTPGDRPRHTPATRGPRPGAVAPMRPAPDGRYRGLIAGEAPSTVYLARLSGVVVLHLARSSRMHVGFRRVTAQSLPLGGAAWVEVRHGVVRSLGAEPHTATTNHVPAVLPAPRDAAIVGGMLSVLPRLDQTPPAAGARPFTSTCPSGWNCADVGNPAMAGGESFSNGSWTITGEGSDIGGTADQFHYDWQSVTGDSRMSVRLANEANYIGPCAKAGVMYRASTDPGAISYSVDAIHNGCGAQNGATTIHVQYRTAQGGVASDVIVAGTHGEITFPMYLRVTREGSTFASYYSTDGANWSYLLNSSATLSAMPAAALLGMAVTSNNTSSINTGYFDTVSIDPAPSSCPSGWNCAAVGNPTMPGTQQVSGGNWTIEGEGSDIGGTADQLHYDWKNVTGDARITVRLTGQNTYTGPCAKAGVMYRASTDPAAPSYMVELVPNGCGVYNGATSIHMQYRTTQGGSSTSLLLANLANTTSYPIYLRIAREGSSFFSYYSYDNVNWSYLLNSSATIAAMPGTALLGMAVTSNNTASEQLATFDGVVVDAEPNSCPSGWTCGPIGNPTMPGAQQVSGGSWAIEGEGSGVGGTSDQFHFAWQAILGDGTMTEQIVAQQNYVATCANTGVMYRASTDPSSASYMVDIARNNCGVYNGVDSIHLVVRTAAGATATDTVLIDGNGRPPFYPFYLRVKRQGSVFSSWYSTDGVNFSLIGGSQVSIAMPPTALVGLAITSDNTGAENQANLAGVSGTGALPASQDRCSCSRTQPATTNPVNTRTGNYFTGATDLVVSSPGPALGWIRTYNSQATGDADYTNALGYGWQEPYATHLVTASMPGGEPGTAIVATGNGNRWRFADLGNGQYQAYPGVYATLTGSGGTYTETLPDGSTITFNAGGQATAMADGHGGQLALQYDGSNRLSRIVDAANAGRYLAVDYTVDGTNHIADITDPAGRMVQYSYSNGDLTQTTDVMGRHVTYSYNTHLLTEVDNNLGQPEEHMAYDQYTPAGRVVSQTLQDGEQIAFDYQPSQTTITTTGTGGAQSVEQVLYDDARNAMTGVVDNGVTTRQAQWDSGFAPATSTDGDGNTTRIQSNAMGQPVQVVNALGQTSGVQYDTQNRPITATDTLGRQTSLTYDSNNNLTQVTSGITTTTALRRTTGYVYNVRYPGKNWLEQETAPDGVVTRYDYDALGQVADVTVGYGTAQALATGYGYDSLGRVITTTVGLGTPLARADVTRYNPDNTIARTIRNYVTGAYDPAHPDRDIVTRYGYDALGRPAWTMDTLGHVDATHYNAAGQVDWTLKNLQPVHLDGNGDPIVPATPPAYSPAQPDANVATLHAYDGLGRTSLITQTGILTGTFTLATRQFGAATTRATQIQYDGLSRPITTTVNLQGGAPANSSDANQQYVTRYDNAGNATWRRDPLGRWTETLYDALNRPYETIRNYENGDPTTVDPANRGWTDGSDTDLISYTKYNPDATVASTVDNYVTGTFSATAPITDTVTQYSYDPLGRLTGETANYDPSQSTRTDTNRTTSEQYDPATGLLMGERDPLGRWASTRYDALGRPATVTRDCTDAGGAPVAAGCAAYGAAHPDRNVADGTQYDALGRAYQTTDPLGRVAHTDYDGLGRTIDTIRHYVRGGAANGDTNVETTTAYDGLGEVVSSTDADGNTSRYAYDGLGDRVSSTDPVGRTSRMGYDGTGTLRWRATADGRVTVYNVDGLGRTVATIANYQTGSSTAADQDLTALTVYDAGGRAVQAIDPAGVATASTYDLLDRQTSQTRNYVPSGGTCANPPCNVATLYHYDRAGNRIAVTDPNGHTRTAAYDAAGERVGATDALGRTTGYSYDLGGRLVGTTDPRGAADNLSYSYDQLDRLVQTSAPALTAPVGASYDAAGDRLTLADGTGTTSFGYDALGRVTQVQAPATGTVGYGYDASGQRTGLTYPDGTQLAYRYWPDGQLRAVQQGGTTLAGYAYDSAGRLQTLTRSNGTATGYRYDGADNLAESKTTAGTSVLADYSYTRDRLGQVTTAAESLALPPGGGGPGGHAVVHADTSGVGIGEGGSGPGAGVPFATATPGFGPAAGGMGLLGLPGGVPTTGATGGAMGATSGTRPRTRGSDTPAGSGRRGMAGPPVASTHAAIAGVDDNPPAPGGRSGAAAAVPARSGAGAPSGANDANAPAPKAAADAAHRMALGTRFARRTPVRATAVRCTRLIVSAVPRRTISSRTVPAAGAASTARTADPATTGTPAPSASWVGGARPTSAPGGRRAAPAGRADAPASARAMGATVVAIDAGGAAVGGYAADTGFSGGDGYSNSAPIDTSGVANPAPQAVYQSIRYGGAFGYTISGLVAGAPYLVRLHFAELINTNPGQRVFNVGANGAALLAGFDIVAAAGAPFVAVVRELRVAADANGAIALQFTGVSGSAQVNGLEVAALAAADLTATAGPTATATPGTPTPTAINAGGPAAGAFAADTNYGGGDSYATGASIDTSGVTGPAPQAVYQSMRFGQRFSYAARHLTPGAPYLVRLHFAETIDAAAGQRVFGVAVNGAAALTNFDIVAAAGGPDVAVERDVRATADAGGSVLVTFAGVYNNAVVSGVEVLPLAAPDLTTTAGPTATATPGTPTPTAIDAGGPAAGAFAADTGYGGGDAYAVGDAIDTSGVANPAPQAVYRSYRYGAAFSYAVRHLPPGEVCTLRLHFAETTYAAAGQRVFDVAVNGAAALTGFDIYAAAGAKDAAVVRQVTVAADAGGTVLVTFAARVGNAQLNGLELLPIAAPTATPTGTATSTATNSPTASATATATPVPTSTRTVAYRYDGLRRLVGAAESPGSGFAYSYDAAGNRTGVAVNGTTTASYSYDAADRVQGWGYDAAGNLTGDGTTTYSYDALNRLAGTSTAGQTASYAYNGDGTLVGQTVGGATTSYTQDPAAGQSRILAATTGIATTDYLYGGDTAPLASVPSGGSARAWYGVDGRGSVRQTLGDAGNVLGIRGYDPYGQVEAGGTLAGAFGYTGELQDPATGNVYLRARWYRPGQAALLGVDPALDSTDQPYAYAGDNPVNYADPSGRIPQFNWDCAQGYYPVDGLFEAHDFAESFYLWHKGNRAGACEVEIPKAAYAYYKAGGYNQPNPNPQALGRADVVDDIDGKSDLWEFAPDDALLDPASRIDEHTQARFYVWRASVCPANLPPEARYRDYGAFGNRTLKSDWAGPRDFYIDSVFPGLGLVSPPVWFPAQVGRRDSYIYIVVLTYGGLPGVIGFKFFRWKLTKEEQEAFEKNALEYATAPATSEVPSQQELKDYWQPYRNGRWGPAAKPYPPPGGGGGGIISTTAGAGLALLGAVGAAVGFVFSVIGAVGGILSPVNAPVGA